MRIFCCLFAVLCLALVGGWTHGSLVFNPAWRTIQVSGGGANAFIHAYSDSSITAGGDTFGAWNRKSSGSCTLDGTTYAAPCWDVVNTIDSMPNGTITWASSSGENNGPVDYVKAPSNLAVQYDWFQNKIYRTTNNAASWIWTGLQVNYAPNSVNKNNDWMAVDPNNPDIVLLITPKGTFGPTDSSSGTLLINTTATTCTSSCWTAIAGIPAPSGAGTGCTSDATPCGGNIKFDQTSAVVGGATQTVYVSVGGSGGIWKSTTGAAGPYAQITTGTPPTNVFNMTVDKFGQLWSVEGFRATGGAASTFIYRLASGTWTKWNPGSSAAFIAVMQDPNTGALVANNQMIAIDNNGQITATLNNGTDSWAHTIGLGSITLRSFSPQAPWLDNIEQYGAVTVQPNLASGCATIDPNTGVVYVCSGVDMVSTPDPISGGVLAASAVYSFDTLGANQLVANKILNAPGLGPVTAVWDRGVITSNNPDVLATVQFPNKNSSPTAIIVPSWGLDYPAGTPTTLVATLNSGLTKVISSSDGGNSWNYATNAMTSQTVGTVIAASTATNWVGVAGQNIAGLQFTSNGAATAWSSSTITGTPGLFVNSFFENRQPIAADRVTAGTFYAVDINKKFFSSTDGGANFAPTGATSASTCISTAGGVGLDRILAAPGNAGHVFYEGANGTVCKSTNSAVSFTAICSGLDNSAMFGFGAPKPGGGGYPAIAAYQIPGGTLPTGYYTSTDAGSTCSAMNVPASEQVWASHVADFPSGLSGDPDVYGRWYVSVKGSGPGYYIDTADACPWVNFNNVNPNDSLTGASVTLTARHSGLVPVTGVVFLLDGTTQIGGIQTGQSTYSVSFNASGQTVGSHTLSVYANGNGCSGGVGSKKTIPITTH